MHPGAVEQAVARFGRIINWMLQDGINCLTQDLKREINLVSTLFFRAYPSYLDTCIVCPVESLLEPQTTIGLCAQFHVLVHQAVLVAPSPVFSQRVRFLAVLKGVCETFCSVEANRSKPWAKPSQLLFQVGQG